VTSALDEHFLLLD